MLLQETWEGVCSALCLTCVWPNVGDSDDEGFYYNEEEALDGIGADGRAAMLNHLDSLLDATDPEDLEEVWHQFLLAVHGRCFHCMDC